MRNEWVHHGEAPRLREETVLLPHQKEGLRWFRRLEHQSLPTGGLLADDMGLGKTLQCLAFMSYRQQRLPLRTPSLDHVNTKLTVNPVRQAVTLVVVPLSLLKQWESEIARHLISPSEQVLLYRGPERHALLDETQWQAKGVWVMITTYETVQMDSKLASAYPSLSWSTPSTLFDREWFRLVVDEAHVIRSDQGAISSAVRRLRSDRRWAMSGTPFNNQQEDMISICQFLGVPPWNRARWWRNCGPKQYRLDAWSGWRQRHYLRRTKRDIKNHLPPCHVDREYLKFPPLQAERLFVDHLGRQHFHEIQELDQLLSSENESLSDREFTRQADNILKRLLRLRQSCNHPAQCLGREWTRRLLQTALGDGDHGNECSFEWVMREWLSKGKPFRYFGTRSKGNLWWQQGSSITPLCHPRDHWVDQNTLGPGWCPPLSVLRPSTKFQWCLEYLEKRLRRTTTHKTVIFSQWGASMDLLEYFCVIWCRHRPLRFDGSLNMEERQRVLTEFRENPQSPLLLCSLQCAAVGLNLVQADEAVILDPWYNPMLEEQARDRIHRLGQKAEVVRVHRLLIQNSVEDHVVAIQERKKRESDELVPCSHEVVDTTKEEIKM